MVTFIDEWRRKFPSCMVVKRLNKRVNPHEDLPQVWDIIYIKLEKQFLEFKITKVDSLEKFQL